MKTLIIGANGQLGSDLLKVFQATGDEVIPVTHAQLDVSSEDQVREVIGLHKPDMVLNTAAYHRVEECEKQPALAFQVNGTGVMNLAIACRESGAVLAHFSTDYVFGGYPRHTPYEETDRCAPLSVYGASKVLGEHLLAAYCERYFLIRTCGLYGVAGSAGKGGNFVETMLKKAAAGESIRVVNDQILTPTYTGHLAEAVRALVSTDRFGLYHLTSEGQCSWYEFTRHLFDCSGVDAKLTPVATGEFFSAVKRPAYSVLSKKKFRSLGFSIPPWQEALATYLEERKNKVTAPLPVSVR